MTSSLKSEDAATLVAWSVETIGKAIGVDVDQLTIRRQTRETLGDRDDVSGEQLNRALTVAAEVAGLRLYRVDPTSAVVPLLTTEGEPLAVTERRGEKVLVHRPQREPEWHEAIDTFSARRNWWSAAPAAPLATFKARGDHHASAGQRLAALLSLERDDLQIIVTYAVVVGLLSLATPVAVQALVSTVAFGTLLQPIVVLSFMLLAALTFQKTLIALQTRVVESIQERAFVRTAIDLAWRLPRVKREEAEQGFGPGSADRFFEVVTLQKTASILLTDGLSATLQIGIGLMVLAFYHPALLAFDLVLLALLLLVVLAPRKAGLSTSIAESYAKYDVAAWLEQLARPGSALRGAGGVLFAAERADALTGAYLTARRRHFRVLFLQTLGSLGLQVFASAALLGLGGWLVTQQSLTLGQLVAAELIVAAIASSIGKLGKLLDAGYDLLTSLDKLGHLVDLPIEAPEHAEPIPGQGALRIEVHGGSEGNADSAPISFVIPKRDRLALVGAEGHPLGEWLAGLRDPSQGIVSFNGVESSRARAPLLREHIAFVQRGDFFEGSVLENITLGRVGVSTTDARSSLERVGLLEELRALPAGLDTHLTHHGAPLTHSQLTRLLVARAITGSPRLIVVDESLESIEPGTRALCVEALTRADADWTLVALVSDASVALAQRCTRAITLEEVRA